MKRIIRVGILALGIVISTVFGSVVVKNGNPDTKVKYQELKDFDKGNEDGFDLNLATKEQLMRLNGVGEVYSQRIIETREKMGGFQSIDDLLYVKGIGVKRLEEIRPYVKIK